MQVLRGHEFQIDAVNKAAALHIVAHSGRGHIVIQLPVPVGFQLLAVPGGPGKIPAPVAAPAQGVHLRHPLDHLKKPGPAGNPVGLQGGRDRQANGFLGTAGVCHHQMGSHGVQAPLHALYGSVKGF